MLALAWFFYTFQSIEILITFWHLIKIDHQSINSWIHLSRYHSQPPPPAPPSPTSTHTHTPSPRPMFSLLTYCVVYYLFREPGVTGQGVFELKDILFEKCNKYFMHFNKTEQAKVKYTSFIQINFLVKYLFGQKFGGKK